MNDAEIDAIIDAALAARGYDRSTATGSADALRLVALAFLRHAAMTQRAQVMQDARDLYHREWKAAQADAERYRWLRESRKREWRSMTEAERNAWHWFYEGPPEHDVDAAIDYARGKP